MSMQQVIDIARRIDAMAPETRELCRRHIRATGLDCASWEDETLDEIVLAVGAGILGRVAPDKPQPVKSAPKKKARR